MPHQQLSQSRFSLARLSDPHDQVLRGPLDLLRLVELALRLPHLGIEAPVKHPQNHITGDKQAANASDDIQR